MEVWEEIIVYLFTYVVDVGGEGVVYLQCRWCIWFRYVVMVVVRAEYIPKIL